MNGNVFSPSRPGPGEFNFNVPKYTGALWYCAADGSDSNDGKTPGNAFATIGHLIDAMFAGDGAFVKAGTYVENIVLAKNNCELHFELGTSIEPATGVAISCSGNSCYVGCDLGAMQVIPAAGESAVIITGDYCYAKDIRVQAGSSGTLGIDVQGNGVELNHCKVYAPLTAGFKVSGDLSRLEDCGTAGEPGDSSIGFWITGDCEETRLRNCGSHGHVTAGYQVDVGCTAGVIIDCYTGNGDGRWTDPANAFVWINFRYEKEKANSVTFTAAGGVGGTGLNYNVFKITGAVNIIELRAHVETVIPAVASNMCFELYSAGAADVNVPITANSGPNINADVVGTLYSRLGPAVEELVKGLPVGNSAVVENANYRDPKVPIGLVEANDALTYLQLVLSAAQASGKVHVHVQWEPMTEDGFLEIV